MKNCTQNWKLPFQWQFSVPCSGYIEWTNHLNAINRWDNDSRFYLS